MSYAIDANILLYASDEAGPRCKGARRFLTECARRAEPLCLCWPVLMAYLRISTHSTIFAAPLNPKHAGENVQRLLDLPQSRVLSEGERFWECYRLVAGATTVRGNLVPDAHIAALLLEHDVRVLYTNDTDFRKFDTLTVRSPFH